MYEFVHCSTGKSSSPAVSVGELAAGAGTRRRRGVLGRRRVPVCSGTHSFTGSGPGVFQPMYFTTAPIDLSLHTPVDELPAGGGRLLVDLDAELLEVALALGAAAHDRVQRERGGDDAVATAVALGDQRVVRDAHAVVVDAALDGRTVRVLVVEPAEIVVVDVARGRELGGEELGVAVRCRACGQAGWRPSSAARVPVGSSPEMADETVDRDATEDGERDVGADPVAGDPHRQRDGDGDHGEDRDHRRDRAPVACA